MTAQQLKNAILQLAIQGKLVPQDANDEPASALLAKIRKEKEQLVKAGKLKPACRQAGKKDLATTPITDEEKPFEIPESWEWCRLGEIGIFERGNGIKRDETFSSGKPCVRYGEMYTKYRYNPTFDKTFSYTSQAVFDKCRKAHNGDLFMALTGENKQDIALAAQYTGNEEIAVGGDLCHFSIQQAYALFFVYVINSQFFSDKKELLATGDIIVHISADKLGSIPIPLPPLAEQHRIVSKIEELMPLVEEYGVAQEKLNQLNEALPEALKKSILQQAIQGKLVPQDPKDEPASVLLAQIRKEKEQLVKAGKLKKKDLETTPITDEEKPFEIPESWEWCKIGEFADIINGFTPLRTNPEFWNNGNIAWFTVDDIHEQGRIIKKTNQHISTKALAKNSSRILPIDTLLLCCTASVGEYALTKIPLTTNQQFNGITIRKEYTRLVSPYYLFAIAPQFKGWLLNLAGKTTFNFVSVKKVSELIIPLPPLSEQRRIVGRVEELMELVDGMEGSDW